MEIVTESHWTDEISYTIDGVDINEIFEGILFAG